MEVYVNRVRRKIDSGNLKQLLHTRRGAGYVLSAEGAEPRSGSRSRDDV
ncbi:MAG: helix-turn-helix domain-containing protein [Candidatus Acidiferrum sp.]